MPHRSIFPFEDLAKLCFSVAGLLDNWDCGERFSWALGVSMSGQAPWNCKSLPPAQHNLSFSAEGLFSAWGCCSKLLMWPTPFPAEVQSWYYMPGFPTQTRRGQTMSLTSLTESVSQRLVGMVLTPNEHYKGLLIKNSAVYEITLTSY